MCSHVRLLNMPVGTLAVNLLGCLLLGLLIGAGERYTAMPRPVLMMLTVGLCGAFTTFSTFSAESIRALESGQIWQSLAYVMVSVGGGLLFFWAGKMIFSE